MTLPNVNDFFQYLYDFQHIRTNELNEEENDDLFSSLDEYVSYHLDDEESREIAIDFGILDALHLMQEQDNEFDLDFSNKRNVYRKICYAIFFDLGALNYEEANNYITTCESNESDDEETEEFKDYALSLIAT